jgi:transcriptional regulator with XRE-family HTH domain
MTSHELAIVIGRAMRQARHALGLTQEQVAEKLELSVEFCSRIERGVSLPSLKTFVRLAEVLRVDVNVLLGFEPTPAVPRQPISDAARVGRHKSDT